MTSLLWRAIRSSSWLTRNDGGIARTPPLGMEISSRQMGHLRNTTQMKFEVFPKEWTQFHFLTAGLVSNYRVLEAVEELILV